MAKAENPVGLLSIISPVAAAANDVMKQNIWNIDGTRRE